MYKFDEIKLVIWDLDESFWKGTLSEGIVSIPRESRELIHLLTDAGIVNSICSKNDWTSVKQKLEEEQLLDYFVFPSVNWESKGSRVQQLISDMQLRPANVLFIDDNPSNREEVRFFCPTIMVDSPTILSTLLEQVRAAGIKDPSHKRLMQYKVLESKVQAKSQSSSNEAFLAESDIRLQIQHDCLAQLDRIHELVLRSNQLNFTKIRSTKEELAVLLQTPAVESGYVIVSDRFGDYGIVGFYAIRNDRLEHFVFSCRTLGMGIEQYVYNHLNRPALEINGEVISDLSSPDLPKWINQEQRRTGRKRMEIKDLKEHTVLVKGPCDLFQIYPYISHTELFDTEFTYVTDAGLVVESTGHTTNIVEALRLTEQQKQLVCQEVPFVDAGIYRDDIFKNNYKVVFISILTDANLGVYRRKSTGEKFAFLEYIHPITDPQYWKPYINAEFNCCSFRFTESILRDFSEQYEFVGRNTPEQIVENLRYIRSHLPTDCTLVIMLGGELYYEKNTFDAYMDRHIVHKNINHAIREWAQAQDNIRLMDVNKYLVDQSSFYDHFNHYIKPVYYALASEMVEIVNETTGSQIKETIKLKMLLIRLKEALAPTYYKLRKVFKR